MIFARENKNGYFILSRNQEKKGLKPGTIRMHIKPSEVLTPGVDLVSTKKGASCSREQVLLIMIFMEAKGPGTISLQIQFLRLMLQQGNTSGIFNISIMMYGIGIFPHRLHWFQ